MAEVNDSVVSRSQRVHGGLGYSWDLPLPRMAEHGQVRRAERAGCSSDGDGHVIDDAGGESDDDESEDESEEEQQGATSNGPSLPQEEPAQHAEVAVA